VHVQVVLGEPALPERGRELADVAAHVAQRGLRGLLHDVAELARDRQVALAGHRGRLDEEDVAAHGRPRQSRRHAGLAGAALGFGEEALAAEQLAGAGLADRRALDPAAVALGHLAGHLAAQRADLALEPAHAGFRGVAEMIARSAASEIVIHDFLSPLRSTWRGTR
jgi:hypothetical protein